MYSLFLLARMHCILPGPHAHCINILKNPCPPPFRRLSISLLPFPCLFVPPQTANTSCASTDLL